MTPSPTELWERLRRQRLTIDGTDFAITLHKKDALTVYIPLARELLNRSARTSRRFLVGVAGPPGAGKTVTAVILAALLGEAGERPVVIPLDGFHYPNSYLDSHDGVGHDGKRRRLRDLKGWHTTFDAERALAVLRRVRAGESLLLPLYSRRLHDPVEEALPVGPEHRVVLVDGNYLYLDAEPWPHIRALFDVRLFVTARVDVLTRQVAQRHVRGGRSEEEARRRIAEVDRPNMDAVLPTRRCAEIVIEGERGNLVICVTQTSACAGQVYTGGVDTSG